MIERDAGDIASKARVKSLVLYYYDAADSAEYIAAVKKYFDGPVFGSADLARYCLRERSATASRGPVLEKCQP